METATTDRCGAAVRRPGFLADDKGAVTMEFTTLVPFFVFLLVLFADASILYLTHSEMYNAARDVARRMATEQIRTPEEARDFAAAQLYLSERNYTIDARFGGNMRATIAVELGDAAITGYFFAPLIGRHLTAGATVRREPLV